MQIQIIQTKNGNSPSWKKTTIMQKSKIYTINDDLLTKLEETTINEGVFVEIRIHVGEGKIVATGSERGNSVDVTMWREEVM